MARRPDTTERFSRSLRLLTVAMYAPTAVALSAIRWPFGALGAVLLLAGILAPMPGRVRFGFRDHRRPAWHGRLAVAFDVAWISTLLTPVTTALVAVLVGIHALAMARPYPAVSTVCALGLALGFLFTLYGVFVRRHWVRVRRVEVAIVGLPPIFDGYRIAHLSDLHVGSITSREEALQWVAATNALAVDLVAVTGDVLTTGTAFHDDVVDVLSELRAPDGVLGCLGNHDYYDEGSLVAKLGARGVRFLRNEGLAIARGAESLFVAGVEDAWRGVPDLAAAHADREDGIKTVLLAHNPQYFPEIEGHDVALVLSGHTHAGQIALPFYVHANPSRMTTRFTADLHRHGDAQIFVHAGLGTTGPAIRIGAAPEVVEIVLRCAPIPTRIPPSIPPSA